MKTQELFLFVLLQICLYNVGLAQRRFSVTIQCPSQHFTKGVIVKYDDGKSFKEAHTLFKNGTMTLTGALYARYAALEFYKPGKNWHFPFSNRFFITGNHAVIKFLPGDTVSNPFRRFLAVNACESRKMGEGKLQAFDSLEDEEFSNYVANNDRKLAMGDSLTKQVADEKFKKLVYKKLEFIKRNRTLYFSFWLFRTQLAWVDFLDPDSLLTFYHSVFSKKYRNSEEDEEIVKLLKGRALSKNYGKPAPDFTVTDISGRTISLNAFKGKFVLIDFWASWCIPCMQNIQTIKEIRAKYKDNKLVIISSDYDRDSSAFIRVVAREHLDWIQIFGNEDLSKKYGGTGALPMLFLIDKDGNLIYSIDKEKDYELIKLRRILASSIE